MRAGPLGGGGTQGACAGRGRPPAAAPPAHVAICEAGVLACGAPRRGGGRTLGAAPGAASSFFAPKPKSACAPTARARLTAAGRATAACDAHGISGGWGARW